MKVALLLSLLLPSISFAYGYDTPEVPGSSQLEYEAWCEGSKVVTTDKHGQSYSPWDCSDIGDGARCIEMIRRVGQRRIVHAGCQE